MEQRPSRRDGGRDWRPDGNDGRRDVLSDESRSKHVPYHNYVHYAPSVSQLAREGIGMATTVTLKRGTTLAGTVSYTPGAGPALPPSNLGYDKTR